MRQFCSAHDLLSSLYVIVRLRLSYMGCDNESKWIFLRSVNSGDHFDVLEPEKTNLVFLNLRYAWTILHRWPTRSYSSRAFHTCEGLACGPCKAR